MIAGVLNAIIRNDDAACVHNDATVDFAVRKTFPAERLALGCDSFNCTVRIAVNYVVATTACDAVIACAAIHFVVAVARKNNVVARTGDNQIIIAKITRKDGIVVINKIAIGIASVIAINQVVAGRALDSPVKVIGRAIENQVVNCDRTAQFDFHQVNAVHVELDHVLAVVTCAVDPLFAQKCAGFVIEPDHRAFFVIKEREAFDRSFRVKCNAEGAAASVVIWVAAVAIFRDDQRTTKIGCLQIAVTTRGVRRVKDHRLIGSTGCRDCHAEGAIFIIYNCSTGKVVILGVLDYPTFVLTD